MTGSFFSHFFCIVHEKRVSKNSAERSISFPSLRPAESPFPPYRPSSRGWANTSATVQRGSRWIEERMEERKREREREETGAAWKGCTDGFWGWRRRRQRGVLIEWLSRRDQRHFRATRYTRARVRVYVCTSRCLCSHRPTCVVYTECFT